MIYFSRPNQGVIIEWTLAFIFFLFVLSFGLDFQLSNVECRRLIPRDSKRVALSYVVETYPVAGLNIVVKDAQFFPAVAGGPSFEVHVTF